jgi:hypothetical protein
MIRYETKLLPSPSSDTKPIPQSANYTNQLVLVFNTEQSPVDSLDLAFLVRYAEKVLLNINSHVSLG